MFIVQISRKMKQLTAYEPTKSPTYLKYLIRSNEHPFSFYLGEDWVAISPNNHSKEAQALYEAFTNNGHSVLVNYGICPFVERNKAKINQDNIGNASIETLVEFLMLNAQHMFEANIRGIADPTMHPSLVFSQLSPNDQRIRHIPFTYEPKGKVQLMQTEVISC